jgi:hypothetical protein
MPSKWLDWKPTFDTFDTPHIRENPIIHASEGRNDGREPRIIEKTRIPSVSKVSEVPPMPEGVRLINWEPKPAPVILTHYAVVTDVSRFIHITLLELKAALAGKRWQSGHWSVRELVDRLEECGVRVEVDNENVP